MKSPQPVCVGGATQGLSGIAQGPRIGPFYRANRAGKLSDTSSASWGGLFFPGFSWKIYPASWAIFPEIPNSNFQKC